MLVLLRSSLDSLGFFGFTLDFGCMHLTSIPSMSKEHLWLDGGTANDTEEDPGAKDE
jgi:hypothetical protein